MPFPCLHWGNSKRRNASRRTRFGQWPVKRSEGGEKRWREEVEVDSGGFHTPFF